MKEIKESKLTLAFISLISSYYVLDNRLSNNKVGCENYTRKIIKRSANKESVDRKSVV